MNQATVTRSPLDPQATVSGNLDESVSVQPLAPARGNTRLIFGTAIVVIVILFFVFGSRLVQVGQPALATGSAPAFELTTFDGQAVNLANLQGKPVVLNFWASWCAPCREEAPSLQAAWEQYRTQGVMVVGVDYVDTESEARKYLTEFKITYPNGPDLKSNVSGAYHITGVPETYFITRQGKLLSGMDASGRPYANWIGPIPQDALQARIEKLLVQ
ncbi:MAG: redoxin domain-containing protein [Anaerolineae bacterium]